MEFSYRVYKREPDKRYRPIPLSFERFMPPVEAMARVAACAFGSEWDPAWLTDFAEWIGTPEDEIAIADNPPTKRQDESQAAYKLRRREHRNQAWERLPAGARPNAQDAGKTAWALLRWVIAEGGIRSYAQDPTTGRVSDLPAWLFRGRCFLAHPFSGRIRVPRQAGLTNVQADAWLHFMVAREDVSRVADELIANLRVEADKKKKGNPHLRSEDLLDAYFSREAEGAFATKTEGYEWLAKQATDRMPSEPATAEAARKAVSEDPRWNTTRRPRKRRSGKNRDRK